MFQVLPVWNQNQNQTSLQTSAHQMSCNKADDDKKSHSIDSLFQPTP